MNNFIRNINENNQLALALLYGENGSYVPVDMFYLYSTCHIYDPSAKYELKGANTIYYYDKSIFYSEDNHMIVLSVEDCVKLFEKHVSVNDSFSLDKINPDTFSGFENKFLKKYTPYTLDDIGANYLNLAACYKNGFAEMGRNYSLIPVVVKTNYKDNERDKNYPEEKYADFNMVRKLKKRSMCK